MLDAFTRDTSQQKSRKSELFSPITTHSQNQILVFVWTGFLSSHHTNGTHNKKSNGLQSSNPSNPDYQDLLSFLDLAWFLAFAFVVRAAFRFTVLALPGLGINGLQGRLAQFDTNN